MFNSTEGKVEKKIVTQEKLNEIISCKAYELYEKRGCQPGNAHEDWAQAQALVAEEYEVAAPKAAAPAPARKAGVVGRKK